MKTRFYKMAVTLLLLINSVGALTAGYSFMAEPSGAGLHMTTDWLKYSPFTDFFIPGLVLFLVNGFFGLLVLTLLFFKHPKYPLYILLQGILLGGWVLMQMLLLRTVHFLQLSFLAIAVVFLVLGFLLLAEETKSRAIQ